MKLFFRSAFNRLYIFETKNSYLEADIQWRQFLHFRHYNWITVDLLRLSIDWQRSFWNMLSIDVAFLGITLYYQYSAPTREQKEKAIADDEKIEAEIHIHDRLETLARAVALRAAGDGLSQVFIDEAKDIIGIIDDDSSLRLVDMTEVTDSPIKLKDLF